MNELKNCKENKTEGLFLFKEERMITVTDNWYPCYEGNQVKLSIFIDNDKELDQHCVVMDVWGLDDHGYEIVYEGSSFEDLKNHYDLWKAFVFDKVPDGVDADWFVEHCFYPA